MALKFTIDNLVEVPGPLRSEYEQGQDGKFHLVLDGHPDSAKFKEARANNIELMKERTDLTAKLAAFDGIDIGAAKAALAKAAAGDDPDLAFKLQQAESKAAAATQRADALLLHHSIADPFIAVGGRPEATDYIVAKAPFAVVDGAVVPKEGAQGVTTVEEWLVSQLTASAFAFHPSRGGGAPGAKAAVLGSRSNVKELVNPTPQQLGAAGSDIIAGKLRVAHTS